MQIPEEIRKCVFFILYLTNDNQYKLAGTGFFLSIPLESEPDRMFVYLITAKHVIIEATKASKDGKIWLRINTQNGSELIPTQASMWESHSEDHSIDAAILLWAPETTRYDYKTLPMNLAATEEIIIKEAIGIGDEIFLTGLFVNHHGRNRNIPIVRIGNIAAMPEEPIPTKNFGDMEAYLIEARSIGGLSGSPAFVYLDGTRIIANNTQIRGRSLYWLGLMHGHWDLPILKEDIVVEDKVSKEAVNMGIGMVVPASKIIAILNQPSLIERREQEENKIKTAT